jgi:peptidyl-prolyl cis-trans isomerase D
MIEYLREKTQSKVAIFLMGLVALSFALFGLQNYLIGSKKDQAAVVIDGHRISPKTIAREQESLLMNVYRQTGQKPSAEMVSKMHDQALAKVVVEKAKLFAARDMGFYIDHAIANAAIVHDSSFQQDGAFDKARYLGLLNAMKVSEKEFFDNVIETLTLNQFSRAITETGFVLPNEASSLAALEFEQRRVGLVTIPESVVGSVSITAKEVADYYQTHQAKYMTPEQVKIDYIMLNRAEIEKNTHVTETQLSDYYHNNINQYVTEKKYQMMPVSLASSQYSLADVSDFMAKKPSLSEFKKRFTKASFADKVWMNAARARLTTDQENTLAAGQWLAPSQSGENITLSMCWAIKPSSKKSLQEVKQTIRGQLQRDQAQQQFLSARERMLDQAYAESDSLEQTAKTMNLRKQTSQWFTQKANRLGILASAAVVQAAFSEAVLHEGHNSGIVPVDENRVMVLRIAQHRQAQQKPLPKVRSQIQSILTKEQRQSKWLEYAQKLAESLNGLVNDSSVQRAIEKRGLRWSPAKLRARSADNKDSWVNLAFTQLAVQGSSVNAIATVDKQNKPIVIYLLGHKKGIVPKNLPYDFHQVVNKKYGEMEYSAAGASLVRQATITDPS